MAFIIDRFGGRKHKSQRIPIVFKPDPFRVNKRIARWIMDAIAKRSAPRAVAEACIVRASGGIPLQESVCYPSRWVLDVVHGNVPAARDCANQISLVTAGS